MEAQKPTYGELQAMVTAQGAAPVEQDETIAKYERSITKPEWSISVRYIWLHCYSSLGNILFNHHFNVKNKNIVKPV